MQVYYDLSEPIFVEALTHRSYVKEYPESGDHNERLEFLGDAVLQLCITDLLMSLFPDCREGDWTRMRHLLVDTVTLAELARELNLPTVVRLGRGERRDGGGNKDKLLADVVEALLGATYQTKGLETCQQIVAYHFTSRAHQVRYFVPAKQQLMEWCQTQYKTTPIYKVQRKEGPAHDSTFYVGVYIQDVCMATGSGSSKKSATNDAAVAAVKRLRQEGAME